jgi:hypothetical protein
MWKFPREDLVRYESMHGPSGTLIIHENAKKHLGVHSFKVFGPMFNDKIGYLLQKDLNISYL